MLPAPTTTSPASSTALIGARRRCSAAWKHCRRERGIEGLGPQPLQQRGRRRLVQRRRPDHGAEAPRVVQAQRAAVGDEVEVIVGARRRGGRQQRQRTRHAQVQRAGPRRRRGPLGRIDRRRTKQRQPEVFAAPRHLAHRAPRPGPRRPGRAASARACPAAPPSTRAPSKGAAIPRRVTSTSGSSGMGHYVRMTFNRPGVTDVRTPTLAPRAGRPAGGAGRRGRTARLRPAGRTRRHGDRGQFGARRCNCSTSC